MIDTHSHPLLCKRPLEEWVKNASKAGVSHIVCVATTIQMGLASLALSQQHPFLIPTIGIHPCEAAEANRLLDLQALVTEHPFKAIGEIGLDFYREGASKQRQLEVFETQLTVANTCELPVIIHSRCADKEMVEVLSRHRMGKKVIHCFSSDMAFVKAVDSEQMVYSFTGMITYDNNPKIEEVIRYLPLEKIMIETDAPYLTPKLYKGQENQPAFVKEVALKIASLKQVSIEEVLTLTTQTARAFFQI